MTHKVVHNIIVPAVSSHAHSHTHTHGNRESSVSMLGRSSNCFGEFVLVLIF